MAGEAKSTSFFAPPELVEWLEKKATRLMVSVSDVIRMALAEVQRREAVQEGEEERKKRYGPKPEEPED